MTKLLGFCASGLLLVKRSLNNENHFISLLDIDECATPGICGNGTCTNVPGSYLCTCAVGFKRGRSSPSCQGK